MKQISISYYEQFAGHYFTNIQYIYKSNKLIAKTVWFKANSLYSPRHFYSYPHILGINLRHHEQEIPSYRILFVEPNIECKAGETNWKKYLFIIFEVV